MSSPFPPPQYPTQVPAYAPSPAPKKSRTGCLIAAIVAGVLGMVAVLVVLFLALLASKAKDAGVLDDPTVPASTVNVAEGAKVVVDGQTVTSPCFTFDMPDGYVLEDGSTMCTVAVNIPGGDELTRIEVRPNARTGSAGLALSTLERGLTGNGTKVKSADIKSTPSGLKYANVTFESGTLLQEISVLPTSPLQYKLGDSTTLADGFMVGGNAYNDTLAGAHQKVADTFRPAG